MSDLTVVVPVLNEEACLPLLCHELLQVFAGRRFRVLLVDDGSTDQSAQVISSLSERYAAVTGLSLQKNYGQAAALLVGVGHCDSDFVISFDADLEYCPEDLLPMLELLEAGCPMVNGYRLGRRSSLLHTFAKTLARGITGKKLVDPFCPIKGFHRQLIEVVGGDHPMLSFPGLALLSTVSEVVESPVRCQGRRRGESKYHFAKLAGRFLRLCQLWLSGCSPLPSPAFVPISNVQSADLNASPSRAQDAE